MTYNKLAATTANIPAAMPATEPPAASEEVPSTAEEVEAEVAISVSRESKVVEA